MDHIILQVEKCCSSCSGDPKDKLKRHMCDMGFKNDQISLAIERCGLQSCLGLHGCVCLQSSIYHLVDFINAHFCCDEEKGLLDTSTQNGKVATKSLTVVTKKQQLIEMGYEINEICQAIDICGEESDFEVLVDCIYASHGYKKDTKGLDCNVDMKRPQRSCIKDTNGLDCNVDMKSPQSSCGLDNANINMPSYYKMNEDNFDVPFDYSTSDGSSNSSEEERDMSWAGGASCSGVGRKKSLKRKHIIEELQKLDEHNCESDGTFLHRQAAKRSVRGFSMLGGSILEGRTVNNVMKGPPYFYFENVALMPKCEWQTITRFFNGVEPEFVDSVHFSACHRQRGYVHNLPLEGREVVCPKPPMTIEEAFPDKMKFRPSWDLRTKMNCINTVRSSSTVCRDIADTLLKYGNDPPLHEQKRLLCKLRKFNLLWVNPGLVAPLEPGEMEVLLGFDEEHTRGTSSMTERYKALGNSFQVDTVAYHLSALRPLYAHGIKVLSLFSGIGGAEVALHKAGIPLKVVVSVEGNPRRRDVLESWWKRTRQTGRLLHRDDVQALNHDVLHALFKEVGGFDLVIGGSPCNNLTGSNRVTRVGLEGEYSRLFFEFPRIYNLVKQFQEGLADIP